MNSEFMKLGPKSDTMKACLGVSAIRKDELSMWAWKIANTNYVSMDICHTPPPSTVVLVCDYTTFFQSQFCRQNNKNSKIHVNRFISTKI